MKGLFMKDLLTIRRYGKVVIAAVAIMLVFAFWLDDFSFVSAMVIVFGATLPITVFSYDTLAHWDGYSLTLPVTRRQLVTSKYLLGLVLSLVGSLLSALINLVGEGPDQGRLWLILPLIFLGGSMVYLSILLPLVYQFGAEKSRLLIMLILILPFSAAAIYEKTGGNFSSAALPVWLLTLALPLAIVAIMVLSWYISCRIYERKEF